MKSRRGCPAEVAGQPMHRKGMAEAGRRYAVIEHGEVGRVKDGIAQPGEGGSSDQHRIAGGEVQGDTGQREAGDAAGQHAGSAEAVDQEAGHGLADPGNDEEDRGRRADAGEAEAELRHQPGKERRQQQVEEMRDTVHEADQGDDFEILGGGWRGQGGGGHGRTDRRKGASLDPSSASVGALRRRKYY
jgi:hypothetical protein